MGWNMDLIKNNVIFSQELPMSLLLKVKILVKSRRKPYTDIFTPNDTDIDRRGCQRIVPMSVLILGMGRTGTASIREALIRLGYNDTYHMMSASVENPSDCLLWQKALEAKYQGIGEPFGINDWDKLLGHCQAVCDWPAIAFVPELLEAYPDAKVIIQTRELDKWHESVLQTVHWRVTEPKLRFISRLDWGAGLYYPMLKKFFDTFFEGDFPGRGKEIFRRHYADLRNLVRDKRVLEYHVSQGWGPLCEFLGKPQPCEPFPRGNDVNSFVSRCNRRTMRQFGNVAFRQLVFGLFLAVCWLICHRALPVRKS